jgi:hypothetical protein
MLIPKFKGTVQRGRFFPYETEVYDIYLQSLEGKECELNLSEWKKKRTEDSNRYYFGVVVKMIAEEMGETKDEAHAFLTTMFLKDYKTVKEKQYVIVRSTTSLSTKEFSKYSEECKQWASMELGIFIPDAYKIVIK